MRAQLSRGPDHLKFSGYTGRYVRRCHVLEHADNDMMLPYDVVPAPTTSGK